MYCKPLSRVRSGGISCRLRPGADLGRRTLFDMSLATFVNLTVAAGLGIAIGFERQWNQGVAGLRTNALVAFGAACFVTIGRLMANDDRVAAQIVSGIGFLGAGVIFREGPSVRGLNTAATIWCSGACGALAGAGLVLEAG